MLGYMGHCNLGRNMTTLRTRKEPGKGIRALELQDELKEQGGQ
jgi:hypothetical protein